MQFGQTSFHGKRIIYVIRKPGEELNEGCVIPTVKHADISFMVHK